MIYLLEMFKKNEIIFWIITYLGLITFSFTLIKIFFVKKNKFKKIIMGPLALMINLTIIATFVIAVLVFNKLYLENLIVSLFMGIGSILTYLKFQRVQLEMFKK